ncbi:MAG TPA: hypothetical protein PLS41_02300 [Bacteroidales bacterium]|nr:hypothetical protein [Bacteroidales bacterium]
MNWKSTLLWVVSFVLMITIAVFQRTTGPTYPQKATISLNGKPVQVKLPTSADNDKDAIVSIPDTGRTMRGYYFFRKFNSEEHWTRYQMHHENDALIAELPAQPAAGKLEYRIFLKTDSHEFSITDDPIVIRFKNPVPEYILIPHILFMFLAMVFSMRTGFEALIQGKRTRRLAGITTLLLFLGGLILGPLVQYFAFGDFWTGWPIGKDLTDTKTMISFIFWGIAWLKLRKNPGNRFWPVFASIILLMVYLIPHSLFGSEFDYSSGQVKTGK